MFRENLMSQTNFLHNDRFHFVNDRIYSLINIFLIYRNGKHIYSYNFTNQNNIIVKNICCLFFFQVSYFPSLL